jgi:hypothetical protein
MADNLVLSLIVDEQLMWGELYTLVDLARSTGLRNDEAVQIEYLEDNRPTIAVPLSLLAVKQVFGLAETSGQHAMPAPAMPAPGTAVPTAPSTPSPVPPPYGMSRAEEMEGATGGQGAGDGVDPRGDLREGLADSYTEEHEFRG